MILATETFEDSIPITQKIFLPRSVLVAGIRTHFLKVGILIDGTLSLLVKVDGVSVTSLSKTFNEINALGANWHGMLSWEFNSPVNIKRNPLSSSAVIEFIFTISSHTDSDSIYTALVHSPDPATAIVHQESGAYFPTYGQDQSQDIWNNPFELELYVST